MIEVISAKEANNVINTRKPIGQFLVLDKGTYIGIDNNTGDAWTEDFRNLNNCLIFLHGGDLEDCLELDGDNLYNKETGETLGSIEEITHNQLKEILDIKNTLW